MVRELDALGAALAKRKQELRGDAVAFDPIAASQRREASGDAAARR